MSSEVTLAHFERFYAECNNWTRWGHEDQRGTLNYISPEKVQEAATLVRSGKAISLQLPLDQRGPQTGAFGRVNPIHQMVATGTDLAGLGHGGLIEKSAGRRFPAYE